MIKIIIPVKSHVKKYLIKRYGLEHTISKKTFLGIIMLELLNEKIDKNEIRTIGFDKYEITIPELYFNTKGFSIDRNRCKFLGLCLEKLFMEDFYSFVDLELTKGNPSAWKSVSLFLKIHDINESELKLESMYRNYQRYSGEKITEKKHKLIAS